MYEQFYGFSAPPFQLTPDHRFFFESSVHKKAAAYLLYGLNQGEGFIVITGEVGAGKTTLLKHLLSTLDPHQYKSAEVVTSQLAADDLLSMVATAWGINPLGENKASTLTAIEQFLYSNLKQGCRCLLLIDEAQNLSIPAIEELRMLSNFQVEGRSPLQSILIGQPQFRQTLAGKDMEQLRQRVIASFHLDSMGKAETAEYVRHRLRRVGWTGDPSFSDQCMDAIYTHTEGTPRRINTLTSRLLLFGFLDQMHAFDSSTVEQIADELRQELAQLPSRTAESCATYRPEGPQAWSAPAQWDLVGRVDHMETRCTRLEQRTKRFAQLFTAYITLADGSEPTGAGQ